MEDEGKRDRKRREEGTENGKTWQKREGRRDRKWREKGTKRQGGRTGTGDGGPRDREGDKGRRGTGHHHRHLCALRRRPWTEPRRVRERRPCASPVPACPRVSPGDHGDTLCVSPPTTTTKVSLVPRHVPPPGAHGWRRCWGGSAACTGWRSVRRRWRGSGSRSRRRCGWPGCAGRRWRPKVKGAGACAWAASGTWRGRGRSGAACVTCAGDTGGSKVKGQKGGGQEFWQQLEAIMEEHQRLRDAHCPGPVGG
ncbi:uncharacterized protein LOC134508038 [Chroicocephalus ridibundus]|uniref:uncharacterized protein LOC134508038 n=1 Tax=Chroicocephalus ridibundus TaxID=1192867 RepID=UPI002FDDD9F9